MKITKILGGFVSLGLLAALAVPFATAKQQAAPAAQAEGKRMGTHDKLQAALDSLDLTDDQKGKVKDIFADAKTKRQAVMSDTSLNEDQKKAKVKELHEGLFAKLNEVLTPDQQAALKTKMAVQRRNRLQSHDRIDQRTLNERAALRVEPFGWRVAAP